MRRCKANHVWGSGKRRQQVAKKWALTPYGPSGNIPRTDFLGVSPKDPPELSAAQPREPMVRSDN